MATIQVTPKECLFGQIDNAWFHVCKLKTQLKLPRQTPRTFPSTLLRAQLGKGSGQAEGEGVLVGRRGGGEWGPDSQQPSRSR